jgi:hypothetical protein
VALVTVGDKAVEVEEFMLKQEETSDEEDQDVTLEIREFRGIELHVESGTDEDGEPWDSTWAVAEGVLSVGSPVTSVERAVSAILDGGAEDPLGSSANYRTVAGHVRSTDAWFFVDIEPWVPVFKDAIEESLTEAQQSGSPLPLDAAALADALGIDALQAFFVTLDMADQVMTAEFGLTYSEDRGLVKVAAYGPGEAPRPAFIPVDCDTFSTAIYDFERGWSALVEIVNGINPSLMGLAAMQLQAAVDGAGAELDLQRDVLENLTGELVTVQTLEDVTGDSLAELEIQQEQIFALGVQQPEALENALETLKAIVGQGNQLFSEREFQGHTIFTFDMPQEQGQPVGSQVAYAITDKYLLISTGTLAGLENVLLHLGKKQGSVWRLPRVRQAIGRLPAGAASIQYQNLETLGPALFQIMSAVVGLAASEEDDGPLIDRSAVPDADVVGRYLSSAVAGVWKDNSEIVIRSWVLPADRR